MDWFDLLELAVFVLWIGAFIVGIIDIHERKCRQLVNEARNARAVWRQQVIEEVERKARFTEHRIKL